MVKATAAVAEQRHDVDQGVGRHLAGEQRPHQRDALGQRQPAPSVGQPAALTARRKEDAGDQRHRRDEQREVIH